MRFHIFYTDNLPSQLIEDHQKVCNKIGVKTNYYLHKFIEDYDELYSAHGNFMTSMMEEESDDVVCFLDIDCLPHHLENLQKAYSWAKENNSFVGNAQNISHTHMRNHLYAAAPCLFVSKTAWNTLGKPSLAWFTQEGTQVDTAQILTLRANQIGFPYQLMYPIGYDGPEEYSLSGYGKYGRGTLYPATWHYFRISQFQGQIPDLWTTRVNNILNNQKIIPNHSSLYYVL